MVAGVLPGNPAVEFRIGDAGTWSRACCRATLHNPTAELEKVYGCGRVARGRCPTDTAASGCVGP